MPHCSLRRLPALAVLLGLTAATATAAVDAGATTTAEFVLRLQRLELARSMSFDLHGVRTPTLTDSEVDFSLSVTPMLNLQGDAVLTLIKAVTDTGEDLLPPAATASATGTGSGAFIQNALRTAQNLRMNLRPGGPDPGPASIPWTTCQAALLAPHKPTERIDLVGSLVLTLIDGEPIVLDIGTAGTPTTGALILPLPDDPQVTLTFTARQAGNQGGQGMRGRFGNTLRIDVPTAIVDRILDVQVDGRGAVFPSGRNAQSTAGAGAVPAATTSLNYTITADAAAPLRLRLTKRTVAVTLPVTLSLPMPGSAADLALVKAPEWNLGTQSLPAGVVGTLRVGGGIAGALGLGGFGPGAFGQGGMGGGNRPRPGVFSGPPGFPPQPPPAPGASPASF